MSRKALLKYNMEIVYLNLVPASIFYLMSYYEFYFKITYMTHSLSIWRMAVVLNDSTPFMQNEGASLDLASKLTEVLNNKVLLFKWFRWQV